MGSCGFYASKWTFATDLVREGEERCSLRPLLSAFVVAELGGTAVPEGH
jgi:hypothetical protein